MVQEMKQKIAANEIETLLVHGLSPGLADV